MKRFWNACAFLVFAILSLQTVSVFGVICYKNVYDDIINGCVYCGVHQLTTDFDNFTSITIFHDCVMTVHSPYNITDLNKNIRRSRTDGYDNILLCDSDMCNKDLLHASSTDDPGAASRGQLNFGLAVIFVGFYMHQYVIT